MKSPTGYTLFEGASELDGAPIVVIAIVESSNRKTGNMVQTYILRSDIAPTDALATGDDESVCGQCTARPFLGGHCYVNVGQGPLSVWRAYKRGNYPRNPDDAKLRSSGRMVRLGTYGDPMAAPASVWLDLLSHSQGHTGYSHQWLNPDVSDVQRELVMRLCMASADSEWEGEMSRALGFRSFRVRTSAQSVSTGEFICPASDEAGKRRTCETCGACNGQRANNAASPVIIAHGAKASRYIRIHSVSAGERA